MKYSLVLSPGVVLKEKIHGVTLHHSEKSKTVADAYLSYIVDNYDSLSEYTLFSRGDVTKNDIARTTCANICSQKREYLECDVSFREWITTYVEPDMERVISKYGYYEIADEMFCVSREHILSRSLDFYQMLRAQNLSSHHESCWYYIFNLHKAHILQKPDYIIVGSGLSGAVMAQQLSEHFESKNILIVEKRDHIGGNCYDYIDQDTGIRVAKYGAHIFHTNNEKVWHYVNRFTEWIPYKHKVYGKIQDMLFPIPININTINILCGTTIKTSDEMVRYLDSVRDMTISEPKNSEEYCLQKF